MSKQVYPTLDALLSVRQTLDEAGKALADGSRTLLSPGVSEVIGTVAGIGTGAAAGAAIIAGSAATGTAGAAALTSGLAAAGGIIGGGMLAGVAVVAAPAVLCGVGGLAGVSYWNRRRLNQERRALLQEAIRKHEAILLAQRKENTSNCERADYLYALVVRLEEAIRNLRGDLGEQAI